MSHLAVTLGKKIFGYIAVISRLQEGAGDGIRTHDVLLGKVVVPRGNCNTPLVTLAGFSLFKTKPPIDANSDAAGG